MYNDYGRPLGCLKYLMDWSVSKGLTTAVPSQVPERVDSLNAQFVV